MKLLFNARISTMDRDNPYATAIAIDEGVVVALGDDQAILSLKDKATSCEDLRGHTIWPGLTDSHIHMEKYALGLIMVDCETKTMKECLANIDEKRLVSKPGEWIRGHGWNQNIWEQGYGNADILDSVTGEIPAFLTAKSLHAAWVNHKALSLANITRDTQDPPGGIIGRLPDGSPDGILYELAMDMVRDIIPEVSIAELVDAIDTAQSTLWKVGLTGIHDYDGSKCFSAFQELKSNSRLKLRVNKSIPNDHLTHAQSIGLRSGFGDNILWVGSVKLLADGALGPQSAAMIEPYDGSDQNVGILLLDSDQITEIGMQACRSGFSLSVHAIGDLTNREALSAFERLRKFEKKNHLPPGRHQIEHVQLLNQADVHRLAASEIIASMQPIHATSDMVIADKYWGKRSEFAYAWNKINETGAKIIFGSDAPVESPDPFLGLHAAVTRRRIDGSPGSDGWYPNERLQLKQALQAYTITPAYAAGKENILGKLAPGYAADLIMLPEDPFIIPPHELRNMRPISTMFSGEWVWRSSGKI